MNPPPDPSEPKPRSRRRIARILLAAIIGLPLLLVAIFAACIAFDSPRAPPPMASINQFGPVAQEKDLPPVETYPARDGTLLAYRAYLPAGEAKKLVVLVHGSSGSSRSVHFLAEGLRKAGLAVYALDIRGHGDSGRNGDIDYIGQLDDDLADFVHVLETRHPGLPRILVGHSAGGGFVLRIAGGAEGELFAGYVLVAPFLRYDAPTVREANAHWGRAAIPRFVALTLLRRLGLPWFQGLPTLAFAVDPAQTTHRTVAYSYRLQVNFGADWDYLADARRITRPVILVVGAEDELFDAAQYAPTLQPVQPHLKVEVVPGLSHMGITKSPQGIEAITAAVESLP
jgi:non-heme chloroperoxidase